VAERDCFSREMGGVISGELIQMLKTLRHLMTPNPLNWKKVYLQHQI
jgi:hypothetical protein